MLEWMMQNTPILEEPPRPFGVFHIVSLGVVLLLFVLMVIYRQKLPRGESAIRISLVIFGVSLLLLEIGKQLLYSYDANIGWGYNWAKFPFQFCSTPIYIALLAMCLPDGKLRQALLAFLATYSPVAGGAVLFYPASSVFSHMIFIDVHTMLWHGGMLLYGLYLWLSGAVRPTWQTAKWASFVYLPLGFVALALNEASYVWGFAAGYDFNMFYIGRLGKCFIPVLSYIQKTCPYPVFFISYVVTLGVGGWLVTLVMMCIHRIATHKKQE